MVLRATGVTLVELVIVILILGIALTGVTQMLGDLTVRGASTYEDTRAIELAESLISEIRSRRFDENSPVNGVPPCDGLSGDRPCTASEEFGPDNAEASIPYSRNLFDDVDDYHGLDEGRGSETGHPLVDATGTTRGDGYTGFRVQVEVVYSGDVDPISKTKTDGKKVVITIDQPSGDTLSMSFHVANF